MNRRFFLGLIAAAAVFPSVLFNRQTGTAIYFVTNRNTKGPGSLREALQAEGRKIIIPVGRAKSFQAARSYYHLEPNHNAFTRKDQ